MYYNNNLFSFIFQFILAFAAVRASIVPSNSTLASQQTIANFKNKSVSDYAFIDRVGARASPVSSLVFFSLSTKLSHCVRAFVLIFKSLSHLSFVDSSYSKS